MTDKTNEANESVKKIPRKRPKWNIYKKMRRLTLHEGIALTYNISPPHMSILIEDDEELLNKYCTRLKMARRECSDKGSIEVIERGQEKDGSDWTVTTDSFLRFVEEMDWKVKDDFKDLGSAAPNNNKVGEGAKVKRKAPDAFVAALIRLLVEISRQAALSGKTFDVRAMPGQKADFYKLVARFDADLRCNSADTFSTYLKGLCQFVQ